MPWDHCDATEIADDQSCPKCGIDKTAWSMEWNVTRRFQLSRKKKGQFLKLRLIDADDGEVADEPYEVELPDGKVVKGKTDDYGYAKVAVPTADADCKVRFPERDDIAWEAAPEEKDPFAQDDGSVTLKAGADAHRLRGWDYAVVVRLELDPKQYDEKCAFRLFDPAGGYDKTKTLKENRAQDAIELLFGVPKGDTNYSLELDPDGSGATKYLLLEDVPYVELDTSKQQQQQQQQSGDDDDDDGDPDPVDDDAPDPSETELKAMQREEDDQAQAPSGVDATSTVDDDDLDDEDMSDLWEEEDP